MVLFSSHQLCRGGNCGPLKSSPCHQTCYQKIENESLISEYPIMTAVCYLPLSTIITIIIIIIDIIIIYLFQVTHILYWS